MEKEKKIELKNKIKAFSDKIKRAYKDNDFALLERLLKEKQKLLIYISKEMKDEQKNRNKAE
jgi:uncharacterized membrane protein (DUF106 family)